MQLAVVIAAADGALWLSGPGGERAITLHGAPVRVFEPGWNVGLALAGEGLALLLLAHEDGRDAVWFLDDAGGRIGDDAAGLPGPARMALDAGLARLVAGLHGDGGPDWLSAGPARARGVLAGLYAPGPGVVVAPENPPAPLDARHLAALLGSDHQANVGRALREGALVWPSPVDGRDLACAHGIAVSPFLFLYRIVDAVHDVVAYVVATQHRCEPRALFLPAGETLIARSDDDAAFIGQHLGADIGTWLGRFALAHAPDWRAWRDGPAERALLVLRETHLGHHLWNELAGLEGLLADQAIAADPPEVLVCNHGLSEMWGRIEALFPALAGRVRRGDDGAGLAVECLAGRVLPLRPSASRVSVALAARVRAAMAGARAPARRARPLVVFNPRTENRTATDLVGLFAGIALVLLEEAGPFDLVIDGHNAHPGGPTGTLLGVHWDRARGSPLEAERAVAAGLSAALAGRDVGIIDNLGAPLSASIGWACVADFHVSIWGAGLAKYAWVARLPGLALTSRWNLASRHDLRIYDDDAWVEQAPLLLLPAPGDVTDHPGAPQLVPIDEPRFWNFSLDPASQRDNVRRLLRLAGFGDSGLPDRAGAARIRR